MTCVGSTGVDHARAFNIAERVDQAWRAQFAGSDMTIPLSVVAALTLLAASEEHTPGPADQLLGSDARKVAASITGIWRSFGHLRPDLLYRVLPLAAWTRHRDLYRNEIDGIAAVTEAAVSSGLVDLAVTGHLSHLDVLGPVVMTLRAKRARDRDGQFFTPSEVARMSADVMLGGDDVEAGARFCEPAAGTGGMLLAAAEALRERGHDPASMVWVAADVDPLIAACLAVNVHRWGLGPNVLIGCANTLGEGWTEGALRERQLGIEAHRSSELLRLLERMSTAAYDAAA